VTDPVHPREVNSKAVAIVTCLVHDPRSETALDLLCDGVDLDELAQIAMALAMFLSSMIREVPPEVRTSVLHQLGLIAATTPETA
jgi:hypothetical protein